MALESAKLTALVTGIATLAGGVAAEKMSGAETSSVKHEVSQQCDGREVPVSCVAENFASIMEPMVQPAMDHPEGAAIGAATGLFGAMLLLAFARSLDREFPLKGSPSDLNRRPDDWKI